MNTQELLDIMQRHNIQGEADKDGDIHFTHEDISMTLLHDDDDPEYISLGAGFEDIDEELHEACYALAAAISQAYKVGKVIVFDDEEGFALRFSVEALVSPETYAALDRRARAEGHSISQEARAALDRHLAR